MHIWLNIQPCVQVLKQAGPQTQNQKRWTHFMENTTTNLATSTLRSPRISNPMAFNWLFRVSTLRFGRWSTTNMIVFYGSCRGMKLSVEHVSLTLQRNFTSSTFLRTRVARSSHYFGLMMLTDLRRNSTGAREGKPIFVPLLKRLSPCKWLLASQTKINCLSKSLIRLKVISLLFLGFVLVFTFTQVMPTVQRSKKPTLESRQSSKE